MNLIQRLILACLVSLLVVSILALGLMFLGKAQLEHVEDHQVNKRGSPYGLICSGPRVELLAQDKLQTRIEVLPTVIVTQNDRLGLLGSCIRGLECGIIREPYFKYPDIEIDLPDVTVCRASFTLGGNGRPRSISVICDDVRFRKSAETGVATALFETAAVCHSKCPEIGQRFDYPIEYRFED